MKLKYTSEYDFSTKYVEVDDFMVYLFNKVAESVRECRSKHDLEYNDGSSTIDETGNSMVMFVVDPDRYKDGKLDWTKNMYSITIKKMSNDE